ncbi:hypothetical protein LXL04_031699 [Taraxacum kok-saghyz]
MEVKHISDCFVKPKFVSEEAKKPIYFSPWDLAMINVNYIQKGLLFPRPENQDFSITTFLEDLKDALSTTLTHFHPLAARLATIKQESPPSCIVYLNPENSPGARFIHSAVNITVAEILTPVDVPVIVQSFFDHHKAIDHDGHHMSLLSIQVTELADGIFIGCSINHMVVDGSSYWHFFNSFSEVFRSKAQNGDLVPISRPPVVQRWIPEGSDPIFTLPFTHEDQFIDRPNPPLLRERIFHFSPASLSKLKAKSTLPPVDKTRSHPPLPSSVTPAKQTESKLPALMSSRPFITHHRLVSDGSFYHGTNDQGWRRHIFSLPPRTATPFSTLKMAASSSKRALGSDTNCWKSGSKDLNSHFALSAVVWRCVTRARRFAADRETGCNLAINNRRRLSPPLPDNYLGNSIQTLKVRVTTGELLDHGVGWAAWRLHEAVANQDDKAIREFVGSWVKSPFVYKMSKLFDSNSIQMGSSPRFDMYGNEFGLGKGVAVLSGYANKFDGKVTLYEGREGGGSMDLEICLLPENMEAFECDEEFMNVVNGLL